MTGQRWASSWSLDMVPPQGDDLGRDAVDRARSVAGEACFRNGHIALDCRSTASMIAIEGSWLDFGVSRSTLSAESVLEEKDRRQTTTISVSLSGLPFSDCP